MYEIPPQETRWKPHAVLEIYHVYRTNSFTICKHEIGLVGTAIAKFEIFCESYSSAATSFFLNAM
jgi:hypothetical protein